jgi:hypothetical protein
VLRPGRCSSATTTARSASSAGARTSASGFHKESLTCNGGVNIGSFCDPAVDREMARAQSLESTDPEAANRLWSKIDRQLTDAAPNLVAG